jgi:hypothetical protein
MFSTGRGDTARRFLAYRGPRRLKQRYASGEKECRYHKLTT